MAEGYYGYNPAQFANDFSWMGEIGDSVKQLAAQVPEFLTLNREIKENNTFKQKSFAATNKFIDAMNPNIVSNIASSMGINYADVNDAKAKLKAMIPKFSQDIKNEDYAKQVTDSFFSPFLQNAFSGKGGGELSMGDILSNVDYGVLQDAIRSSSAGKEQLSKEAEDRQQKQTLDTQQKGMEQKYTFEQEAGKKTGGFVNTAIQSAKTPEEAYKTVIDAGGTDQDAEQARKIVSARIDDETKAEQLRQAYAARLINKKDLETVDPSTLPDMIVKASSVVGRITDDIEKLKVDKKKSGMKGEAFNSQLAQLNNQLVVAKENQKALENANRIFLKESGKTKEDVLQAQQVGQASVGAERSIDQMVQKGTVPGTKVPPELIGPLNNIKKQFSETGKVSPEAINEIRPQIEAQGISVVQFLQANGINYNDGTQPSQTTQAITDKDKQYLQAYNDPGFQSLPDDKKNIVMQYLRGKGLLQ